MAVRYAVANGNWSATSTWDGGASIPTTGDDVYANSYTVNIDQDIEVAKISTEVCPTTSVGGGRFVGTKTGDTYITANIIAGLSGCLSYWTGIGQTTSRLYIIGDVYGGSITGAWGIFLSSTAYPNDPIKQPIIVGNLYGWTGTNCAAITSRTDRLYSLILTGNATAGTGADCISLTNNGTFTSIIVGNATATAGFSAFIGNHILYFTWIATASSSTCAIYNTGTNYLSGIMINISWVMPILHTTNCRVYIQEGGSLSWKFDTEDSLTKTLYTDFDQPSEADVREWVLYWEWMYEWTLAVPDPSNVASGVPTDDTVWTADFNLSEVMTALWVVNEWVQKASKFIPHTTNL